MTTLLYFDVSSEARMSESTIPTNDFPGELRPGEPTANNPATESRPLSNFASSSGATEKNLTA